MGARLAADVSPNGKVVEPPQMNTEASKNTEALNKRHQTVDRVMGSALFAAFIGGPFALLGVVGIQAATTGSLLGTMLGGASTTFAGFLGMFGAFGATTIGAIAVDLAFSKDEM